MVMRAHAAMSLISNNYIGLDTTSTNGTFFFFFCLSLHECPGGTGSLMRQTLQPFRDSKRHQNWRHIPPHRMQESRGPRLCWRSNICDVALAHVPESRFRTLDGRR
jgi:hypothetical protein